MGNKEKEMFQKVHQFGEDCGKGKFGVVAQIVIVGVILLGTVMLVEDIIRVFGK